MIIVKQNEDGTFERFTDGSVTRMEVQAVRQTHYHDDRPDEQEIIDVKPYPINVKVPLAVASKWGAEKLAEHSLFIAEQFQPPEGKRVVRGSAPAYSRPGPDGPVIETRQVEDIPPPKVDTRTVADKLAEIGLTSKDLAAELKKLDTAK